MKVIIATAVLSVALVLGSSAHAQSFLIEANVAHAGDLDGGELGVGYSFQNEYFRLTPIVGAFLYKGGNDRYRRETMSNGNEICRDGTTGAFAKKENCNNTAAKAYGKLEAAVRLKALELGGGVRVSSDTTPYGLIGFSASDQLSIKAFAGKDYYGAGGALRF